MVSRLRRASTTGDRATNRVMSATPKKLASVLVGGLWSTSKPASPVSAVGLPTTWLYSPPIGDRISCPRSRRVIFLPLRNEGTRHRGGRGYRPPFLGFACP